MIQENELMLDNSSTTLQHRSPFHIYVT